MIVWANTATTGAEVLYAGEYIGSSTYNRATASINPGVWVFVGLELTTTTATIYIDEQDPVSAAVPTNMEIQYLGRVSISSSQYYWNGLINQFRIMSRAATAVEREQMRNEGEV